MSIETLGVDIAKNVFQLHGVNRNGRVVLKRRVMRDQLVAVLRRMERMVPARATTAGQDYLWAMVDLLFVWPRCNERDATRNMIVDVIEMIKYRIAILSIATLYLSGQWRSWCRTRRLCP
jgi:hypothetical protein